MLVQCSIVAKMDDIVNQTPSPVAAMMNCSSNEECEVNSLLVNPVIAGQNYSCTLSAVNKLGRDELSAASLMTSVGKILFFIILLLLLLLVVNCIRCSISTSCGWIDRRSGISLQYSESRSLRC